MRKTFKELVSPYYKQNNNGFEEWVNYEDVLELMETVRLQSLIEASDYAEADYNIINTSERAELFREDNIEIYVLKESILQLDKNSIEI